MNAWKQSAASDPLDPSIASLPKSPEEVNDYKRKLRSSVEAPKEDSDDDSEEDEPGFNWEKPFYFRRDGDRPAFSTLLGVLEGPQEKPDDYVAPVVAVAAAAPAAPITLEAAILAANQADTDVVATVAAEQAASAKLDADRREKAAAKALWEAERKKQGGVARMIGNPGAFGHEDFPPRCPYAIASEAAREKAKAAHALVESLKAERAANAAAAAAKAAAARRAAAFDVLERHVIHCHDCVCFSGAPDVSNMPAAKPRPIKTMYTIRKLIEGVQIPSSVVKKEA